jgi:hypothetical protein
LKPALAVEHGNTWQQQLQTWSARGLLEIGRWRSTASSIRHETASFAAWIDPEAIGQSWGPHGFISTTYSMEAQTGGVWKYNSWLTGYIVSFAERTSYSAKPCRK